MTLEEAIAKHGQPDARGHVTRYSDSSLYDEICVLCGMTDAVTNRTTVGNTHCPGNRRDARETKVPYADLTGTPREMEMRRYFDHILRHHGVLNGVLLADLVSCALAAERGGDGQALATGAAPV